MRKALKSSVEEIRLDFSNVLDIPCDGDAKKIQQEIDNAVSRAAEKVLTSRDATVYDFSMAMELTDSSKVPVKITVIPPRREAIPATVSIEEASRMVTGYSKCAKLFNTFHDANRKAQIAMLDIVLRQAIKAMLPDIHDVSINGIIAHARMTNGSYAGTVNACETECRLIANILSDVTGKPVIIPQRPLTRKPVSKTARAKKSNSGKTEVKQQAEQQATQAAAPASNGSTTPAKTPAEEHEDMTADESQGSSGDKQADNDRDTDMKFSVPEMPAESLEGTSGKDVDGPIDVEIDDDDYSI